MKDFIREFIIYQLVAVMLTLIIHHDAGFLRQLPGYLVLTNCIGWSIRTIFVTVYARFEFLRWKRRWRIVFGLLAIVVGSFTGVVIASLILRIFFGQDIGSSVLLKIFKGSLPLAAVVTILILIYTSLAERLETQAVEKERLKGLQARAELAALQSRLNPHFLFNTLNTMANLVHKEPDKVEEMILRLSDVYRKVLKLPMAERISLAEEFDLARQYLAIEQVRLGDRLCYDIRLPDKLRETSVPPLLIQPLVENAVIHGIMPESGGGKLQLSAEEGSDRIRIVIEDDGTGINLNDGGPGAALKGNHHPVGQGFGLHSTRERLRIIYDRKGAMKIESPAGRGTRITLEIPVEH